MPARVWTALAGLIAVLLIAVVGLDQWQSRRGEASLFGLPWWSSPAPATPSRVPAAPRPRDPLPAPPAPPAQVSAPRVETPSATSACVRVVCTIVIRYSMSDSFT